MIEVKGLSKYYGDHKAIDNVSFRIAEGEIVGLLGLNGAGKSTILKVLASYLAPTAGEIFIDGHELDKNPEKIRSLIGYLPDTPPIYDEMRVEDFLKFVASLKGVDGGKVDGYVAEAIERANLSDVSSVLLGQLSHGFKQRVGIAQAIVHRPKILILDEPINGLDPVQIVDMRDMVLSLRGNYTVILSSHILSEITQTCDQILILDRGHLVAEGEESLLRGQSTSSMKVVVEWQGEKDVLTSSLERFNDIVVEQITETSNGFRGVINCPGDYRSKIAKSILSSGGELTGLGREGGDLEDLFMKLVTGGGKVNG